MSSFQTQLDIDAPAAAVWAIASRLTQWPGWTSTVTAIEALDGEALRVGARFNVQQPKLPPAIWQIDAVVPGESFTWHMNGPGVTTSATYRVVAQGEDRSRAELHIAFTGLMAEMVWMLAGRLATRYLTQEAEALKAAAEGAATPVRS